MNQKYTSELCPWGFIIVENISTARHAVASLVGTAPGDTIQEEGDTLMKMIFWREGYGSKKSLGRRGEGGIGDGD